MSKILIFSDAHIHPHKKSSERLQDCIDALEWVFKTAKDRNIDNIIFVGDLFHHRQQIIVPAYQKTFETFSKYIGNGTEIYLLLGNHDLWHANKWDVSSVFPLQSIEGVSVISKPCTLNIGGTHMSVLPYTHDPVEDLKTVGENKDGILFGHVAIDGALWNVMARTRSEVSIEHDGDMTKVNSSIFKDWKHTFLGHYHAEQKLATEEIDGYNVEYVGSPLQLSFGEAFQHKHIIEFDPETGSKEYIRNTFSPQHLIIPEKDLGKYDLKRNFIKVEVDDIAASDIIEMRQDLISNHRVGSLEIKQKEKKINESLVEDAKAILFKESEMLEHYVEQEEANENIKSLDKKKLINIGKGICNVAQ